MEDYFDGFSEDIKKWEIIREMIDLDLDDEFRTDSYKTDSSVQLLPRQDVILYGTIPKMEQKMYTKCKECRLVFNPRDILAHKTSSGKTHISSANQNLIKKVKSKGGSSSKKSHSSVPLPPLFKKPLSPLTVVSSSTLPETKSSITKVSLPVQKYQFSTSAHFLHDHVIP